VFKDTKDYLQDEVNEGIQNDGMGWHGEEGSH
jgi:hypothetical protein